MKTTRLVAVAALGGRDRRRAAPAPRATGGDPITLTFQSLAFQEARSPPPRRSSTPGTRPTPTSRSSSCRAAGTPSTTSSSRSSPAARAPDIIHFESAAHRRSSPSRATSPTCPAYLSDDVDGGVSEDVWETVTTVDGEIIAAPTLLQSYVVFANTDVLEAAGVEVPTGDTLTLGRLPGARRKALTTDDRLRPRLGSQVADRDDHEPGARLRRRRSSPSTARTSRSRSATPRWRCPSASTTWRTTTSRSTRVAHPERRRRAARLLRPATTRCTSAATTSPSSSPSTARPTASTGPCCRRSRAPTARTRRPTRRRCPCRRESEHVEEAAAFINFFMSADNLAARRRGRLADPGRRRRPATWWPTATGGENGWDDDPGQRRPASSPPRSSRRPTTRSGRTRSPRRPSSSTSPTRSASRTCRPSSPTGWDRSIGG